MTEMIMSKLILTKRTMSAALGAVLLLGLSGVPAAVAEGEADPSPSATCLFMPTGDSLQDVLSGVLGDHFVEIRLTDGREVIGVYKLPADDLAGLLACGFKAENIVAYPVSARDVMAAQSLVMERLSGLIANAYHDFSMGTVTAGVPPEDLAEAISRAEADPELRAMMDTQPETADKVHLEFEESHRVYPAPGDPVPADCGVSQAMLTPWSWAGLLARDATSVDGRPPTVSTVRSLVLRACTNGDLGLYNLDTTSWTLGSFRKIGSGFADRSVYAPGDWDRDGLNDLISVDQAGKMFLHSWGWNNVFKAAREIGHGWGSFDRVVPAGDLTRDGNQDLLAVDAQGRLFLYEGNGYGGWKNAGVPKQVGHGWGPFQLIPGGDLNADGVNDIMGIRSDGKLFMYASKGGGTFQSAKETGHGWIGGIRPVSGGSLDGDSAADLVAVTTAGSVLFYHGRGAGTFDAPKVVATGWQ
jgi:hypothetical protein